MNNESGLLISLLAGCLLASTTTYAEPVFDIIDNGPGVNRVDIVFVGDGYTADELGKYESDVEMITNTLFEQEPFLEYQDYFNVRRIDVTSVESGADHPDRDIYRDTALGAYYNCNSIPRLLCVNNSAVSSIVRNNLSANEADITVVLVNEVRSGGSGGRFAVSSMNSLTTARVIHEIGHAFGKLADEYTAGECRTSVEPYQVNVTMETNPNEIKWKHWIDPNTEIPTYDTTHDQPGLYEGAKYCTSNVFRPTYQSIMRHLSYQFGAVNEEALVKRIYAYVSPLDTVYPNERSLTIDAGHSISFAVEKLRPLSDTVSVQWFLDDYLVGDGLSHTLDADTLGTGTYTLRAEATDATNKVISDPYDLLVDEAHWAIQINNNNPVCSDPDGDGWGWDGVASCRVTNTSDPIESDPEDEVICIDSDGDGWGWDGVASCRVTNTSDPVETDPQDELTCVDPDGDGWGWNGIESCKMEEDDADDTPVAGTCVDTDGDGWGWDGVASCRMAGG